MTVGDNKRLTVPDLSCRVELIADYAVVTVAFTEFSCATKNEVLGDHCFLASAKSSFMFEHAFFFLRIDCGAQGGRHAMLSYGTCKDEVLKVSPTPICSVLAGWVVLPSLST